MTAAHLLVDRVSVRFGARHVLDHFSLDLAPGEIVGLVGPSGCGKSTALRVIAGLQAPDAGKVLIDGHDVTATPAHRRNVGMIFQDQQLFGHLDVAANIAYALTIQRIDRATRRRRVDELLAMVGLDGFADRAVRDLSGGEAQRVALARSLAPEPRVLLLDEPFSALDRSLHDRLCTETRALLRKVGITAVHVTHDDAEAAAMCDRVVSMLRAPKSDGNLGS